MPYQLQGTQSTEGSSSIAFSADGLVMAVGQMSYTGALSGQGCVRIYDKSLGVWNQRGGVLIAPDAAVSDWFGASVALSADGNTLVVGATQWESAAVTNQGGVYVYDRSGTSWTQRGAVISASTPESGAYFGNAVALSADGNTLVIGEVRRTGGGTRRGSVYTYDRSGTSWTQRGSAMLGVNDYAVYGAGVALSADGNTLAVGATGYDGATANQGGVYVYDRSGTSWTQRGAVLVAADAVTQVVDGNYDFGASVSLSSDGNIIAVGAIGFNAAYANQGAAYLFDRNGTGWTARNTIVRSDMQTDRLGSGVAVIGNALLAIDDSAYTGAIHFFTIGRSPVYAGSLTFSRPENGTAVGTATFTDPDGDTLTYTLSGADAAKFTITSTGALAFKTAPNFENPTDAG